MNVPSNAFYPNLSRLLGIKMLFTSISAWKIKKYKFSSFFVCDDSQFN